MVGVQANSRATSSTFLVDRDNNEAINNQIADSKPQNKATRPIGKTPDGEVFVVPETHDMVRSLFDPTLRKSYGEIMIFLSLAANFWIYKALATHQNRICGFLGLYAFWRLCYNVGIGCILDNQSKHKSIVTFAKCNGLFNPASQKTLLQRLSVLEVSSKMGPDYKMETYPIEYNTWLVFRQLVDLILMQDFTTYMFLVYTAGQDSAFRQTAFLNYIRFFLGIALVGFNLWVKLDAHRVVKDYAWYWGDFFFLQESELIFDGVFNLSPHPMYSIGYIGYYGFALITRSYLILIVSLIAQALQFAFLAWVEDPHIEKTYGSATEEVVVEEVETHDSYLKPLVIFSNFNPVRLSDYLTVFVSLHFIVAPGFVNQNSEIWTWIFFGITTLVKLTQSVTRSYILGKQSGEKLWTKVYLKYGLDSIAAFSNWQSLYNFLLVSSYSSLIGLFFREIRLGQHEVGNWLPLRVILGSLLIILQIWTSSSIYKSIGDFGWFYGDFFLPNFSKKTLTKTGIYRYLNDPERLLGVSGVWGAAMISFSPLVFILATIWTIDITLLLEFVEKPHMIKVYGEQKVLKHESGVSLTLKKVIPKKVDSVFDFFYTNTFSKVNGYITARSNSQNLQKREAVENLLQRENTVVNESYTLEIENLNPDCSRIEVGEPIIVKWKAPITHSDKDWIGLYPVSKAADSRKNTLVPSFERWVATNPSSYQRYIGVLEEEKQDLEAKASVGVVQFDKSLLWHENGVYELRYHQNDSHKVLAISKPFEIVVPSIEVDKKLEERLLILLKRLDPELESVDSPLNFKKTKAKDISNLISEATSIDMADQIIIKSKTISNISSRIVKFKKILDSMDKS